MDIKKIKNSILSYFKNLNIDDLKIGLDVEKFKTYYECAKDDDYKRLNEIFNNNSELTKNDSVNIILLATIKYIDTGKIREAKNSIKLSIEKNDIDSMIYLGNYYNLNYDKNDKHHQKQSLKYLLMAYKLNPNKDLEEKIGDVLGFCGYSLEDGIKECLKNNICVSYYGPIKDSDDYLNLFETISILNNEYNKLKKNTTINN